MPKPGRNRRPLKNRMEVRWMLDKVPNLAAALKGANLRLDAKGRILAVPFLGCPFNGSKPCPKKAPSPHTDLVSRRVAAPRTPPKRNPSSNS